VRTNLVHTADGAAAFRGRSRPISDPRDLALFQMLRQFADVVFVGAGTVRTESYGPVVVSEDMQRRRHDHGQHPQVPIAVVTASAVLDPAARLFSDPASRPIIVTGEAGAATAGRLHEVADVVVAGDQGVDLATALGALRDRGLGRVLCEGGPTLFAGLVDAGLVDDVCATVSPYLAGSQPLGPVLPSSLDEPQRLRLRHVRHRDGLLYLRYTRP
jgi:riboflavin biosynthesis pyrimidine reductase